VGSRSAAEAAAVDMVGRHGKITQGLADDWL